MHRRKFVAGLGALAAGTTLAIGSGAFESVEAERAVSVEFTGDANAYLGITADDTYVTDDSNSGKLTIDIGGGSGTEAGGEALNEGAITTLEDILTVTNQGTESVDLGLNQSNIEEGVTFFWTGSDVGSDELLSPGDAASLGAEVDDINEDLDGDVGALRIIAEAGEPAPPEPDPASFTAQITGGQIEEDPRGWNPTPDGFDVAVSDGSEVVAEPDVTDTDDTHGEFTVTGLDAGEYTIEVDWATELGYARTGEETVSLDAGDDVDVTVDMEVQPDDGGGISH